ncbi:SIR2 family protein [Peredibacter sp. HCB2-198]|uniref:SIR2 family protein n=1 Tax=Peredibacter sp. HCB2-198 TaxID=3383025 RepID=UPI0038B4ED49
MKFGELDIPEELLESQFKKNLVIFAGAGISVMNPSDLPSFAKLARMIADRVGKSKKDHEGYDQFLGRLEEQKINIRDISAQILNPPGVQFNLLHTSVLRLFSTVQDIRLVTTNFDNLLSDASKTIGKDPEEFFAPALPNGDNFSGIVYLHGALSKPLDRLVITDIDFGRGYLTEGWARRFLRQLFSKYDVLFIGYSHNDLVFNYLSRGLPPNSQTKRFILTHDNDKEKWNSLKITPIIYEKDSNGTHSALAEGLKDWADHSQKEVLDHAERIRSIVSSKPQISDLDNDYLLKFVFKHEVFADFFFEGASTLEWFHWCKDNSLLAPLFENRSLNNIERKFIFWVSNKFLLNFPYEVILTAINNDQKLNPVFSNEIARSLIGVRKEIDQKHRKDLLNLVLSQEYDSDDDFLSMVLPHLISDEDKETGLVLFKHLMSPKVKFENREKYFQRDDLKTRDKINYDIEVRGKTHWLKEFNNKGIKSHQAYFYPRLISIFSAYIEDIYNIFNTYDPGHLDYDLISMKRAAIEIHHQNSSYEDGLQFLFDLFSESCQWIVGNDENATFFYLKHFALSPYEYLKRVSLFMAYSTSFMDADRKASWLLEHNFLTSSGCHHEVFTFIGKIFPVLSIEAKNKILDAIARNCPKEASETDHVANYERYRMLSLLKWICKHSPDFVPAKEALERLESKDENFEISDHADFKSYHSDARIMEYKSELTPEDLLKLDLESNLDYLLNFKDKDVFHRDTDQGVINLIQDVVKTNPWWGFSLAEVLPKRSEWTTKFWRSIFRGWQEAHLSDAQWSEVYEIIMAHTSELAHFTRDIGDLIEKGLNNKEGKIPLNKLDDFFFLTRKLWEEIKDNPLDREITDWLGTAINNEGGRLAIIWMEIISLKRSEDKQYDYSEHLNFFVKVIQHKSQQSYMASCLFCSQLYFMFSLDTDWVKKYLMPLFSFETNPEYAKPAWDGFLSWGKWSQPMLSDLLIIFKGAFRHLEKLGKMRKQFVVFVAGISVTGEMEPLESEWLPKFVSVAQEEDLGELSSSIARVLSDKEENEEIISKAWSKWLKKYWSDRLKGIPKNFYDSEKDDLVSWAIFLGDELSEAVELIKQTDFSKIKSLRALYEIEENKIHEKYPKEILDMLVSILSQMSYGQIDCHFLNSIARHLVSNKDLDKDQRMKLANCMATIGCHEASSLRTLI